LPRKWVLLPNRRGMGGIYWRRCPISVARRGFLAIVAGACLWSVRSLLGRPPTDNRRHNHRQPPTADAEPDLALKLEPLLDGWRRAGQWPAVLVVPPDLYPEAVAMAAVEHDWFGGRDVRVVGDPYCPPGKLYLFPAATYRARKTWGRSDG
jgi:hypothetical protein